jgi:CRISPR system Cascade subunit CasC
MMSDMKFLQIHFLTSYHATLLNRDDAGLAKRITFGGVPRLRVSSQSQKRHWREWMMQNVTLPAGLRTRHFFDRVVKQRLVNEGMEEKLAHTLTLHVATALLKTSGDKAPVDDRLSMKQPVLFGAPEARYLVDLIQAAASRGSETAAKSYLDDVMKQTSTNLRAMAKAAGIEDPVVGFEGALFGRFVTSDILARVDAPVHVAHAFTTHEVDSEVDYFTVVDDLAREEETGAAHANDMELGAGIFYGYVVVDVPLLMSNLTGCDRKDWKRQDPSEARELLSWLIRAISEVSPGAKLGSTAPYARAECVMMECGDSQPRSLANAFLKPIRPRSVANPMAESITAMASYLSALDNMYGTPDDDQRVVATIHEWPRPAESPTTLAEATRQAMDAIFGRGV